MEGLRSWLLEMIAAAMVVSILYALLPKGSLRSSARVTGGLILLLVMLRPLAGRSWEQLMTRYAAYHDQIDAQIENYQAANEKELEELIQARTEAYISDKAMHLGLSCHAQVATELRQGIPYPAAVRLDIPKSAELSEIIARELGIAEEKQRWLGE